MEFWIHRHGYNFTLMLGDGVVKDRSGESSRFAHSWEALASRPSCQDVGCSGCVDGWLADVARVMIENGEIRYPAR